MKNSYHAKSGGTTKLAGIYSDGYNVSKQGFGIENPSFDNIKTTAVFQFETGKLRWGGAWIDHRPRLTMLAALGPPIYNYRAIWSIKELTEDERSEMIRFLLCLSLWERTPGKKIITAIDVWIGALTKGAAFAEEMDDLFALTWREHEQESYNFCFPARFLPRFKEYTDDITWSLGQTKADPDALVEFKETLETLLEYLVKPHKASIKLADDSAILFERTTTTSYLAEEEKTMPHWEASFKSQRFEEKTMRSQRCVVNVYPSGTRDTVICDKAANNSIRWIERSLKEVLMYFPESATTPFTSIFQKRIRSVVDKKGHHVLRDIKKCGLTYNSKELFPIVKECLQKILPDRRWERINLFQDMRVKDSDTEYNPQRGYGLGMGNNLVTLCNIVIYYICINRMKQSNRIKTFKSCAIIGNDDGDVCFYGKKYNTLAAAQEYLNIEHEVQGFLGNLTNMKKSVIKPYGLFYEQYGKPGWQTKESLVCNALACAYLAPNIRTAKYYIHSQSDRFNSKWAQQELINLAAFWGPEFYTVKDELKVSFEVGGWLDIRLMGLKTSLIDAENLTQIYGIHKVSFVAQYCEKFISGPKPIFKTKGQVHNHLYTGPACKSDARVQLYTLSDEDLKDYFKRLTTFQRNYGRRLETFEKFKSFKPHEELKDLLVYLIKGAAWHAMPEEFVEQNSTWNSDWLLPATSEFAYFDIKMQYPEHIIRRLQGIFIPEDDLRTDAKLSENPSVPIDQLKNAVYSEMQNFFAASQFSNSGALPLLEYFYRNQRIPDVKLISGLEPKFVHADESFVESTIIVYSKQEKVLQTDTREIEEINEIITSDSWGYVEPESEGEEESLETLAEFLIPVKPKREGGFVLTDENIDKILSMDNDHDEVGNLIGQLRREAYENPDVDVFADDEDMDFGFFGED
jgi:hypothetical protein